MGTEPITGTYTKKTRGDFYLYCRQNGLWTREEAATIRTRSLQPWSGSAPIRHVTPRYPPTILIHGTADTDVPYAQSVTMDKELTRQGVPHEFITIQNGPHGLRGVDPKVVNKTTIV